MGGAVWFRRVSGLIPAMLVAGVLTLHYTFPSGPQQETSLETGLLIPALNTIFISFACLVLAYVSARGYLAGGMLNLFFLGCGALTFGLTTLVTAWYMHLTGEQNPNITINSCGSLAAGALHLSGAILDSITCTAETRPDRRMRDLLIGYLGALTLVLLLTALAAARELPPFFVQGTGPTLLRQWVLGLSIGLFAVSSLVFYGIYRQRTHVFFYWYSLGLMLLACGLTAFFFMRTMGDLVAWLGRIAIYLGGISFFIALLDGLTAARLKKVAVGEVWADLFRKPLELYTALVQTVSDAVLSLDEKGRVLLWNPAAERMFGYRSDEVIGSNLADILVPEQYAESFVRSIEPSYKRDQEPSGPFEVEAKTRSGRLIHVEVSISRRRIPGQIIHTMVIRDVTRRKETDKALRRSEALYRAIARNFPNGAVYVFDRDLCYQVAEGQNLIFLGYSREQLEGKTIWESLDEETLRIVEPRYRRVLAGERLTYETRFRDRIMLSHHTPLRDEAGQVMGGLVVAVDITDRKRAEDALRKSREELRVLNESLELRIQERTARLELLNKELQDFAFVASHDLQEPLRKIQAFGDLVLRRFHDSLSEEGRDYLSRMRAAAARMQMLLDSLLSYSKVTTKALPFGAANLDEILHELLSDLEQEIRVTGASVEFTDMPVIQADATQMGHLLRNLVTNAMKFHPPGQPPRVRLDCRQEEDGHWIELRVHDQGIGFEEKYLDRIFLPFQRLHRKDEYPGVGIGLAICKKIVDRHGGTITARSAPGKGSTFIVRLPCRQPVSVDTDVIRPGPVPITPEEP